MYTVGTANLRDLQSHCDFISSLGCRTNALGRPSQFAQLTNAERIVALRKPDSSLIAYKIAMIVVGNLAAESAEQEDLPRSRFQKVSPADDFRDLHRGVIDNDRQLVGRNIVTPPHDEVAEVAPGYKVLRPKMKIGERNFCTVWNPKSPVHSSWQRGSRCLEYSWPTFP